MSLLRIENLASGYGDVQVLLGVDLVIQEGQIARQRPVLGVAVDKGVAELAVVVAVP